MKTTKFNGINKMAFILVTLFFGGIGAQYIMMDKTGKFVVSLLFAWTGIPCLVSFVHFIQALCTKTDENGKMI